jgi:hypothetical protein
MVTETPGTDFAIDFFCKRLIEQIAPVSVAITLLLKLLQHAYELDFEEVWHYSYIQLYIKTKIRQSLIHVIQGSVFECSERHEM